MNIYQQQGNNFYQNQQNVQNQGSPNSLNQYPNYNNNYQQNNAPIQQNAISFQNNEDYPPVYQQNSTLSYPGQNSDITIQIDQQKQNSIREDYEKQQNNGLELLGKNTRRGFIRKVYGILSMQLLITIAFCVISMTSDSFSSFQKKHYWLCILCGVISIVLIKKSCYSILFSYVLKVPTNYILLFLFTFCEAYLVSYCCSVVSNRETVLIAAIITVTITVTLTIFAIFTKSDYTRWYHYLTIAFITVIMVAFFCIFWRGQCPILNIIICGIIAIIYGFYLIVDTQMIAGGKKYELSYDDYIIGALCLYIDIIGIFIYILSMLGSSN